MKRLAISLLFFATAAQAAITGTLIDETGKPLAGATVRAYATEDSRAWHARLMRGEAPAASASVLSGPDGVFRIETKAPLTTLLIEAPGKAPLSFEGTDGENLETIVLRSATAKKVQLLAGGKPVANAAVISGLSVIHSSTDGSLELIGRSAITHPDFVPMEIYTSDEGSNELTLKRGVAIRGRVLDAEGKPVANATLSVAGWPLAQSAGDGTFTIVHAPATWRAIVAYDAARAGTAPNTHAKTYDINLEPAASITGTTAPGTRVSFTPEYDSESIETAIAGTQGKFSSPPLPAGRYMLRTFRRGMASSTASVAVKPGEHATKSLPAKTPARIRGRVVDESGQPVAGAFVWSGQALVAPQVGLSVTGKNGEFNVAETERDQQAVYAIKSGYALGSSGPIAEGKNDLTVKLPRGFPLQVHVIDRQRQNVAGATLVAQRGRDNDPYPLRYAAVCEEALSHQCRTTPENGMVTLRVTEGPYEVRVSGASIVQKSRPETITAQSSPLTIEVDRGVEVSGQVQYSDRTPVAGAMVMMAPFSNVTRADDDGTFTLRNLPPGKVTIVASTNNQLRSDPVDVNAPARNVALTITTPARIEGRVFDRGTNQPVTDFQVSVSRRQSGGVFFASTGAGTPSFHSEDGTFTVDPVTPGPIQLRVTASGYAPGRLNDLTAEEGKTLRGVEVPLERGGTLRGRATAGGDPVSSVAVRSDTSMAITDDNGEYTIDTIAAGEQTITFMKAGFLQKRKTVDVARGKETRLDVEMDRGRALQGRVSDKSGRAIAGARISAMATTGMGSGMRPVTTDADGNFTLDGLADGRYTVNVNKDGYVGTKIDDIAVPAQTPLTITLDTGGTITGRVRGLSDSELSTARVSASGPRGYASGRVNADGTFVLNGVPDGHLMVSAMVPGASMRQSPPKGVDVVNGSASPVDIDFNEGITVSGRVTQNGVPLTMGNVSFTGPGHPSGNGQISSDGRYQVNGLAAGTYDVRVYTYGVVFQGKYSVAADSTYDIQITGSSLRGRVVDSSNGAPIPDASVWISPSRGNPTTNRNGTTDSDGHFVLDALPDGTYDVHASSRQHYAPATQSVTISGGSAAEIELRLDPAQATTFRVTDAQSGTPLDAYMSVNDGKGSVTSGGGVRDDDGGIRIYLAPGQYKAHVNARGYVMQTVDFSVPGPDVRVALQLSGRLSFVVSRPTRLHLNSSPPRTFVASSTMTVDGIAAGTYSLDVYAEDGKTVIKSIPVTVVGGQTITVNID